MSLFSVSQKQAEQKNSPSVVKLPRMRNLPRKLTPAQKRVYKSIILHPASFLKIHKRPNGLVCFRHTSEEGIPITNYRKCLVQRMIQKNLLTCRENKYYTIQCNQKD